MDEYFASRVPEKSGEYLIHKEDCLWLPFLDNRVRLGEHASHDEAIHSAKKKFQSVKGCEHCMPELPSS